MCRQQHNPYTLQSTTVKCKDSIEALTLIAEVNRLIKIKKYVFHFATNATTTHDRGEMLSVDVVPTL